MRISCQRVKAGKWGKGFFMEHAHERGRGVDEKRRLGRRSRDGWSRKKKRKGKARELKLR